MGMNQANKWYYRNASRALNLKSTFLLQILGTVSDGVLEGGFTEWDNEKDGYHYDQGNSSECSISTCGHYTQVFI
jgi:hypothetical protein